mmetsp:Transcript_79324/g.233035  ORF Transcript_79324/g.233035 Transcript_79324/m.233035 type:complete len:370 (-) Transcript_79324:83-1192(-)
MVKAVTTAGGETLHVSMPIIAPCGAMGAMFIDEAVDLQSKSKGVKEESKCSKLESSKEQAPPGGKAGDEAEESQSGALTGLEQEDMDDVAAAMSAARSTPSQQAIQAWMDMRRLYELDGFISPLYALGPEEVATALAGFKRFERDHCRRLTDGGLTSMNHVWLPWLRDLAMNPKIVDAVCEVFCTKNVYLYNSQLLTRAPGRSQQTAMGVGWHKDADSHFCRLSPVDRRHWVTAFVALTVCDRDHGCLRVRPTERCKVVLPELVDLELLPGEFSLHGPSTIHTGGLNRSDETRYCIALRYIRGTTKDSHAELLGRDMALLVSGSDKGNFDLIPEVEGEATEEGRALREGILRKRRMGPSSLSWEGMVCA